MERLKFIKFLYNDILPIFENLTGFTVKKKVNKVLIRDFILQLNPKEVGIELIRIGPQYDGGYLIPNDLEGIEALFSPGTGQIYGFEKQISQYGINVFMADASVDLEEKLGNNIQFIKKFIGIENDSNYISLQNWIKSSINNSSSDLMLQMDIEGEEYVNILSLPEDILNRFRIIVIEFHDLRNLVNPINFKFIKSVFNKILKNHIIVHIHPNNNDILFDYRGIAFPNVVEISFIRKDRIKYIKPINIMPHSLDYDNNPDLKSIILPEIWYKS